MVRSRLFTTLVSAAVILYVLAGTATMAHAGRIPLLFNYGSDLFPTGPLPDELADMEELEGYQAGYKCSFAGVFWIYLYWWGCTAVAFQDDTYVDDPELAGILEQHYSQSDMKPGFWKGYMRWVLVLAVIALIVTKVRGGRTPAQVEAQQEQPAQDPWAQGQEPSAQDRWVQSRVNPAGDEDPRRPLSKG